MSTPLSSIIFPGQGVQQHGMAQDFYNDSASARRVFEEASDAVGFDLAELCFGNDPRLQNATEYTQPAILTAELAQFAVVRERLGLHSDELVFGGHSLGEYSALVAAGALPLADAVRLVRERGRLMQTATPAEDCGMTAVISEELDAGLVANVIDDLDVEIANDNSCEQLVLAGTREGLSVARQQLEQALADNRSEPWRFVDIAVNTPFHSSWMNCIEPAFAEVLQPIQSRLKVANATRVTSNFNGSFHHEDAAMICSDLVHQISGTVRWQENMVSLLMASEQVIEIGPACPLRGFFKTLGVAVQPVSSVRKLDRMLRRQPALKVAA